MSQMEADTLIPPGYRRALMSPVLAIQPKEQLPESYPPIIRSAKKSELEVMDENDVCVKL